MTRPIDASHDSDMTNDSMDHEVEPLDHYYRGVDNEAVSHLSERFGDYVPDDRLRDLPELLSVFEDRETFDANFPGDLPEHGQVMGWSRGTVEAAHVATDHLEVPATVYHERLHQLAHPDVPAILGTPLTEGITQDLTMETLGYETPDDWPQSYPQERQDAQALRAECGDEAVFDAYFRGDDSELRSCLTDEVSDTGFDLESEIADLPELPENDVSEENF